MMISDLFGCGGMIGRWDTIKDSGTKASPEVTTYSKLVGSVYCFIVMT